MRKFKLSTSILLELADTFHARFTEDLDLFSGFDKDLNQEFADQLQNSIDTALTLGNDTTNRSKLNGKTITVNEAMSACNLFHKNLAYWIIKAFNDYTAVQQQFGIGNMSKVNKSQAKMILFMENLVETIKEYRTTLEAAGTPAALLDRAAIHADNLRTANIDQEQQKGSRVVDTAERVAILNAIYDQLRKISTVASLLFTEQPEKNKLYQIPYTKSTSTTTNEEE